MTITKYETSDPIFTKALKTRVIIGAGIGLLIVGFFVIGAGRGNPGWGNYWQIQPLLVTPLGGAIVGLCYDLTARLRRLDGWLGKAFLVLSILGVLVGFWMSLILGLAGTMWN